MLLKKTPNNSVQYYWKIKERLIKSNRFNNSKLARNKALIYAVIEEVFEDLNKTNNLSK